jgi:hypothetical protein
LLNIESNGGNGIDALSELQLVQNCGLARRIEAHHKDPDITFELEQAVENALNRAHLRVWFLS